MARAYTGLLYSEKAYQKRNEKVSCKAFSNGIEASVHCKLFVWKWRFFQVLTVQEKAETNQIDKKVKYRKERGRYASSIPMPFSPRLSGASMITPNC